MAHRRKARLQQQKKITTKNGCNRWWGRYQLRFSEKGEKGGNQAKIVSANAAAFSYLVAIRCCAF
jgi:uncharacterized GH25 family protein